MEERGGVLVENEKQANKSVAKVMRITFLIFSVVFLLNVLGIFVVSGRMADRDRRLGRHLPVLAARRRHQC